MRHYHFSARSVKQLITCHEDLRTLAHEALKHSDIDFGIFEGHRSLERQKELYKAGKSKLNGENGLGPHNYSPSRAFDIIPYVNGKVTQEFSVYAYIGGVFTTVARHLYDQQLISHRIRWGGNWGKTGSAFTDQRFNDLPHYELIDPK